jgi:ABC-type multidrug transport system fused ATPase/permease subunit
MSLKKPAQTATRSEKEAYVKALAAISISVLALLLAVTNYFAGRNSSAVLNGTISANNLWTWYGTKNVRATIHEVAGSKDEVIRLRADMEDIEAKARAAEAVRDAAKTKSPWYSYSAMALQLAIVLSSAAILAVTLSLFYASIGVGAIGTLLFFVALGA